MGGWEVDVESDSIVKFSGVGHGQDPSDNGQAGQDGVLGMARI